MNEKNQIIFWNEAAEAILGYKAEEVAGRFCYQILGGRDEQGQTLCQRYCRLAIKVAQGETLPNLDVFARTASGQERWVNVTTFAVPTAAPQMGHMIVHLFRDAADKKNNERFIKQILEASRELRDDDERPVVSAPPADPARDPRLQRLTPREGQVLRLLAHGLGTKEMADTLSISPATIRNHVQSILDKLSVHSRLEAVAYVYQQDMIESSG